MIDLLSIANALNAAASGGLTPVPQQIPQVVNAAPQPSQPPIAIAQQTVEEMQQKHSDKCKKKGKRRRRIDPLNLKALNRSCKRLEGFRDIAIRELKFLQSLAPPSPPRRRTCKK